MNINQVRSNVSDIPHMTFEQAKTMTDFIKNNNIEEILELGFAHGVSTCYMAAALDDKQKGHITSIDLLNAKERNPSVNELLRKCNLQDYVEIFFEPTSYTWRLMKFLENNNQHRYDLCYIDGAHDWFVDGFAFFLVDKMLKPGGWIIFDDIYWTYGNSPVLGNSDRVMEMPVEEKETQQVKKVFDLLVKTHPNYANFKIDKDWAYAQKLKDNNENNTVKTEVVYVNRIDDSLLKIYRKLKKIFTS